MQSTPLGKPNSLLVLFLDISLSVSSTLTPSSTFPEPQTEFRWACEQN